MSSTAECNDCNSCIDYEFVVKSINKNNNLVYTDISDWKSNKPEKYQLSIKLPGKKSFEEKTFEIFTDRPNKLEINTCIVDGVYCFKITHCNKEYSKSIGLFPKIECCLKQSFATGKYEQAKEVEKFLELTKLSIEIENQQEAEDFLQLTKDKLSRLKCNCTDE